MFETNENYSTNLVSPVVVAGSIDNVKLVVSLGESLILSLLISSFHSTLE